MPILHAKEFGIYHWDTFDNETLLIAEADTLDLAQGIVTGWFGERISEQGADQIDIVDKNGVVQKKYKIT